MPSPRDAAAKKPKHPKPVQANNVRNANVLNFNRGSSGSSEESIQKDSSNGSEHSKLVASLTKSCAKCGLSCLPWGRVAKGKDQVCGKDCQTAYDLEQWNIRDELFKASVGAAVPETAAPHSVESFQSTIPPQPHATRRRHQKE